MKNMTRCSLERLEEIMSYSLKVRIKKMTTVQAKLAIIINFKSDVISSSN